MIVSTLTWLLGAVGIALLLAICTPVRLRGLVDTGAEDKLAVQVALLGGILALPAWPLRRGAPSKPKLSHQGAQGRFVAFVLRHQSALVRLMQRLLGRCRYDGLEADVAFGLDDPADTGAIYGALYPLVHQLQSASTHVRVQPVFEGAVFAAVGRVGMRFTPVRLLWPMIAFGSAVLFPPRPRAAMQT